MELVEDLLPARPWRNSHKTVSTLNMLLPSFPPAPLSLWLRNQSLPWDIWEGMKGRKEETCTALAP